MEMNFCRRCGTHLNNTHGHVYRCENGHTLYANSSPAAGVLFVSADGQRVLLSTRAREPNKGMLDAPGGFLDDAETFEDAVVRELDEELGLKAGEYEPLKYLTTGYDEYAYGGESVPFASILYWSRLTVDRALTPADDVASVTWYDLEGIDFDRIHSNDVRIGIRTLQNIRKLEERK